ncbi:hypothetical protein QO004_003769 [Rhizobium mesoamericanum]|uniref:hypothetical protein n=1 Tax=Rhizobium mesoamericanum TaxID=1079800 RepID=UPI0027826B16|nr:hypothetical protein [Rhizobium mesoamericanum]MDQ0561968.1 hypothetical protein [Rhizobium mesoamericanum]
MPDRTPPLVVVGSDKSPGAQSHEDQAIPSQQNETIEADPLTELTATATDTQKALDDLMTIIGLSTAVWSAGMSLAWAAWLSPLSLSVERRD